MAAAAVPLLVHLFARSRPREREFSSLIFLRRAVKRHVRLRRPKDWLLLAVRTLAAACLAAARRMAGGVVGVLSGGEDSSIGG